MHIYAASYLLPINSSPVEGGAIAVDKGLIIAVGRLNDLRKKFTAPVHEFPGAILLPGLVNAHTHLELTHFPDWLFKSGLGAIGSSYVDWIMQVIAVKREVTVKSLSVSLLQGLSLLLQSGTTMVGDILSERQLIPFYMNTPLSGRIYLEFIGQDKSRYSPFLNSLSNDIDSIPHNFLPGIAPHSPFTVSQSLLKSLLNAGRISAIPITMHLSESADESQFFNDSTGKLSEKLYPFVGWGEYLPEPMRITSSEWLDFSGALTPDFLAVHGVHLSAIDIEKLKDRGASIVLVPRSNHKLDVGNAPVKELLSAGIPLSLGTDSLASNDSLSLWDEMKFLLDTFPRSFSPEDALKMATIGGAKAIKRDHEAGTLEPGKRADFIIMETENIPVSGKVFEQLIGDSNLHGVWCGGERIYSFGS
jgi:cytosine/adenosine deaminase-related metal-dependent hydrolase